MESKFHEVLSDNPRFAARNSPLSRLDLTLPIAGEIFTGSFDGNGPEEVVSVCPAGRTSELEQSDHLNRAGQVHLKVPSTEHSKVMPNGKRSRFSNYSDGSPRSRGFSSSRDGDETAEMWKRALRAESISKPPRRSTSSQPIFPRIDETEARFHKQTPRAPCPSEIGKWSGFDSRVHSPTCTELPTQEDDDLFRKSLVRSHSILEEWGRQLQEPERDAQSKTRPSLSGPRFAYKISKTPPASWARFPSHNREERNANANERDNVKPRDFAIKEISPTGGVSWTTDKSDDGGPSRRSIVRSVSDKFTQPFKSRWSKLLPGRAGARAQDRSILGARRSSIQASGDLEYPELEVLPSAGGYRELVALEREINEMKGLVDPKTGSVSDHAAVPTRPSLVDQIANVLQNDGSADADTTEPSNVAADIDGPETFARLRLPVTPASQARHLNLPNGKDMTESSGERYATPLTHFSLSRPLTPQSSCNLVSNVHTPGSLHSDASVIRRPSLCVPEETPDPIMPVARTDWRDDRSTSRRRSAPAATPSFD